MASFCQAFGAVVDADIVLQQVAFAAAVYGSYSSSGALPALLIGAGCTTVELMYDCVKTSLCGSPQQRYCADVNAWSIKQTSRMSGIFTLALSLFYALLNLSAGSEGPDETSEEEKASGLRLFGGPPAYLSAEVLKVSVPMLLNVILAAAGGCFVLFEWLPLLLPGCVARVLRSSISCGTWTNNSGEPTAHISCLGMTSLSLLYGVAWLLLDMRSDAAAIGPSLRVLFCIGLGMSWVLLVFVFHAYFTENTYAGVRMAQAVREAEEAADDEGAQDRPKAGATGEGVSELHIEV